MIVISSLQEYAMKAFLKEFKWMTEDRFKDEFPIFNTDYLEDTTGWTAVNK